MASNLTLQRRSQRAAEESAAFGPIAERFRRAGDLDRAVSLCREGLQKFPNHISARVTLGWSLLDQGKYDEARVELEQVLRRAPDNLAAIRGLAELHDRAEHTMNLPMDGPGQWPPTEESLQEAAPEEFDPEIVREPSIDALKTAVQFADEAPEFDVQIRPDAPAVFTTSSGAAMDVAIAEPEAHAEPAVQAEAVAASTTHETSAATYEAPPDDEPIAAEPIHAEAETVHTDQPGADWVSESDIAALLAEAERLEAAAAETEDATVQAVADQALEDSEPVEVAGEIELEASDDAILAADTESVAEALAEPMAAAVAEPIAEAIAEPVAEAVAEPAAEESVEPVAAVAAEAVADPVAEEVPETVAEAIAEPIAEPVAEEVAEPIATSAAEVATQPVADAVAEPIAEEVVEPIAASVAVAEEPVAEAVAEPVVEAVAAQVLSETVAEVVKEPVRARTQPVAPVAAQTVVEFDSRSRTRFDDTPDEFGLSDAIVAAAIQSSVSHMHLAEIVPMARAARSDPNASTLVKLERFLAQVQARRRELMRQSVA